MSFRSRFSYIREASTSTVVYTALGSVNIVLAILTILGNSLMLHCLRKSQSLHAPTKPLFCSLALSDLGVGLFVFPLFSAYCFTVVFSNADLFCNIQDPYGIGAYYLGSASFLTMTALALDRFYALKFRLTYRQVITFKRTVRVLVACWIFGIAWPFTWLLNERVAFITATIIIFCCIVITSISCIRIYFGIRDHQKQLHAQQLPAAHQHGGNQFIIGRYKKSINTITFIFCLLLACYLPYFTAVGIALVTASNSNTTLAFNITAGIVYLNSLLNPILYCWRIKEIREEVLIALRPCFSGQVFAVRPSPGVTRRHHEPILDITIPRLNRITHLDTWL